MVSLTVWFSSVIRPDLQNPTSSSRWQTSTLRLSNVTTQPGFDVNLSPLCGTAGGVDGIHPCSFICFVVSGACRTYPNDTLAILFSPVAFHTGIPCYLQYMLAERHQSNALTPMSRIIECDGTLLFMLSRLDDSIGFQGSLTNVKLLLGAESSWSHSHVGTIWVRVTFYSFTVNHAFALPEGLDRKFVCSPAWGEGTSLVTGGARAGGGRFHALVQLDFGRHIINVTGGQND